VALCLPSQDEYALDLSDVFWIKKKVAMESPFYTDIPTHDMFLHIKPDAVDDFFRYCGYRKAVSSEIYKFEEAIFPQTISGDNRYE